MGGTTSSAVNRGESFHDRDQIWGQAGGIWPVTGLNLQAPPQLVFTSGQTTTAISDHVYTASLMAFQTLQFSQSAASTRGGINFANGLTSMIISFHQTHLESLRHQPLSIYSDICWTNLHHSIHVFFDNLDHLQDCMLVDDFIARCGDVPPHRWKRVSGIQCHQHAGGILASDMSKI